MKKIVSIVILVVLFLNTIPVLSNSNADINAAITVTELNGVDCDNYLVRRTVPFAKGILYNNAKLCVKDGNTSLVSSCEVMSNHDDGSVKWLLVSFVISLKANETKTLYLTNGERSARL